MGKSSLLSSGSQGSTTDTTDVSTGEDGQLEIRPDNSDLSAPIEDTDKVEITGSCNDLDIKKNRIIVEAFSGENENDIPYVSNAISDYCQQTTVLSGSPSTGNGLAIANQCFWVTKGIGIIEDPNIPTVQKSFPQCHNGRFGFSVRLGGVLTSPLPAGSRYLIRFKIRTLDGIIKESVWNRVYVTRKLNVPSIDKVTSDSNLYSCNVEMSPARFNQNILYTLTRSQVGATSSGPTPIFTNISSFITTTGNSAFSYLNNATSPTKIIAGVTYTYNLSSLENTVYNDGFVYSPALTASASAKTCEVTKPVLEQSFASTNVPISSGGDGATCFLKFSTARPANPALTSGSVSIRWAYSTTPNWTLAGSNYDGVIGVPGSGAAVIGSLCSSSSTVCTATEKSGEGILPGGKFYYYAAQEVDNVDGSLKGKWSNEIECKTAQ